MRIIVVSIAVLLVALTAIAFPTDPGDSVAGDSVAGDPVAGNGRHVARRPGADSIQLAQARQPDAPKRQASATKKTGQETTKTGSAAKVNRVAPITAEIESEVGKFVKAHHRELVDVLAHLKANVPKEYERAVRDLNRNRLRLQQFEGRDRYEAELDLWKAQSRARLLGARLQMGDADGLKDALRIELAKIHDLRAAMLQRDRDRTVERLKKLDEQLEELQKDRDENLEKQLLSLTKAPSKRTKSVNTSARNAKPASSKQTPVKKSSTKTIE